MHPCTFVYAQGIAVTLAALCNAFTPLQSMSALLQSSTPALLSYLKTVAKNAVCTAWHVAFKTCCLLQLLTGFGLSLAAADGPELRGLRPRDARNLRNHAKKTDSTVTYGGEGHHHARCMAKNDTRHCDVAATWRRMRRSKVGTGKHNPDMHS
jgi:hypothetical protein